MQPSHIDNFGKISELSFCLRQHESSEILHKILHKIFHDAAKPLANLE